MIFCHCLLQQQVCRLRDLFVGYSSAFPIFYSVRIIVNWDSPPSHKLKSWCPSIHANMPGVREQRSELPLHTHGEWHAIQTPLGIYEPSSPHQSFNSRTPHMHLPFSKLLLLHFAGCLPDTITNSVETEPSFIFANREISWHSDFPQVFWPVTQISFP